MIDSILYRSSFLIAVTVRINPIVVLDLSKITKVNSDRNQSFDLLESQKLRYTLRNLDTLSET